MVKVTIDFDLINNGIKLGLFVGDLSKLSLLK